MAKDYTAIRVSKEPRAAAEESKKDGETWDEYIQRCAENPPEIREFVESGGVNTDEIVEELKSELSMANEPTVDVDINRLYNRIDELESRLPKATADELQGRQ